MNTLELAQHLRSAVNWQRFVNLAASLGSQLNDAQWRFFKATVLENSVEAYSDGSVQYVAQEGCDLLVRVGSCVPARVEMKYTEHALYSPRGQRPRVYSSSIVLMNSKGTNTHQSLPQSWADYLLIVGIRAAALIDRAALEQHLLINGDSITARVPTASVQWIFDPSTVREPTVTQIDLREQLNSAVKQVIADVA
jgi:hypothetical protein